MNELKNLRKLHFLLKFANFSFSFPVNYGNFMLSRSLLVRKIHYSISLSVNVHKAKEVMLGWKKQAKPLKFK